MSKPIPTGWITASEWLAHLQQRSPEAFGPDGVFRWDIHRWGGKLGWVVVSRPVIRAICEGA